jgi:nitrite reductase/ring-hydroxylating ferredoxin subunit
MSTGFVKVGRVDQFVERRGRAVDFEGAKVAVFRLDGRWHAIQDDCPHMGASLSAGRVGRGTVECHLHGWRFDLETGRSDSRSGACAKVFEVRIEGGDVLLRRPAPAKEPAPDAEDDLVDWDPDRYFKRPAPGDGDSTE